MDPSGVESCRHVAGQTRSGRQLPQQQQDAENNKVGDETHVTGDAEWQRQTSKPSEHEEREDELERRRQELHTRNNRGWRRVVVNFTPSWFSATMGTGIVSILLHNLPYNARWLYWISVGIFGLNVLLFVVFTLISIVRYTLFRGIWTFMLRHRVQSLFLGTVPMGLATIINMTVFVCVPAWGSWALKLAWALWWLDVALSVATNLYLPFVIMKHHENDSLAGMTAAWLLPIVATIVASASGSIVAKALLAAHYADYALITLITSYVLWGCGLPLAMMTLVLYFQRLTIHRLPAREVIVSVFLPLGPLGQGAFAIMNLGGVANRLLPTIHTIPSVPEAGPILAVFGIIVGLIMWGFGLVWLFFAVASVIRASFPFNMGWWGFTFPLGVYAVATVTLAELLPSAFFRVLGTIFSLAVTLLWIVVATKTVQGMFTRKLFVAPCLAEWEKFTVKKECEC